LGLQFVDFTSITVFPDFFPATVGSKAEKYRRRTDQICTGFHLSYINTPTSIVFPECRSRDRERKHKIS